MKYIKAHYLVTAVEETPAGQRINSYWVCTKAFARFPLIVDAVTEHGKYLRTVLSYNMIDVHFCSNNSTTIIDNTEAIGKANKLMNAANEVRERLVSNLQKFFNGEVKVSSEYVPEPDFTMFSEKEIEQRLARYSTERDTHKYNIGERVEVVKVLYGNSPINSKVGKFARIYAFAGLDTEGTPEYFLSFENRLDGYCYRETEISDENVTKETSPEHDKEIEDLTKDQ